MFKRQKFRVGEVSLARLEGFTLNNELVTLPNLRFKVENKDDAETLVISARKKFWFQRSRKVIQHNEVIRDSEALPDDMD